MEFLDFNLISGLLGFISQIASYLDIGVVCIVLFAGVIAKRLTIMQNISTSKKTFMLSVIMVSLYLVSVGMESANIAWSKVFLSFTFANLCYDWILKRIFEKLNINQKVTIANEHGCHCVNQDYYFAREVDADTMAVMLANQEPFDDIIYSDGYIYVSSIDDGAITPTIKSAYVGGRPPRKPI